MQPNPEERVATFVAYSDLTPAVASLTFDCDGFFWQPGQYVEFRDAVAGTRAAFSIASVPDPSHPGRFQVAAARSSSAQFLFGLTSGDEVSLRGPRGKFLFRSEPQAPVTFVGAGTGLAPLRAMLLSAMPLAAQPSALPQFLLLFGARGESDLLWADELRNLAATDSHLLRYEPTLSQPGPSWNGLRGYVQNHLAELVSSRQDGDAYVCGPDAMVTDCVKALEQCGVSPDRIYTESH